VYRDALLVACRESLVGLLGKTSSVFQGGAAATAPTAENGSAPPFAASDGDFLAAIEALRLYTLWMEQGVGLDEGVQPLLFKIVEWLGAVYPELVARYGGDVKWWCEKELTTREGDEQTPQNAGTKAAAAITDDEVTDADEEDDDFLAQFLGPKSVSDSGAGAEEDTAENADDHDGAELARAFAALAMRFISRLLHFADAVVFPPGEENSGAKNSLAQRIA
jgi:hypothetical protein